MSSSSSETAQASTPIIPSPSPSWWTASGEYLDGVTGISGSLGYLGILSLVVIGYLYTISSSPSSVTARQDNNKEEEEEEPDPPRNFTAKQLRHFNGGTDEKTGVVKPVYLSVNGIVFDVSAGKDFYGPGGPYETFAGRECGAALAKMSFDEHLLDDVYACEKLNFGERTELEGWIDKFTHYRCYPVLGNLVPDDKILYSNDCDNRTITVAELSQHRGLPAEKVPDRYATAPIYVAAGGNVYDVSFGGVTSYGPDGPYRTFAGRDASRALAKMSLHDDDIVANTSTADLSSKEMSVLHDWMTTFETKKLYPVVGKLVR